MAKRKAVSTKTRFDIFKRDGFVCQYCGTHPPQVILHVDHIVPVAEGGDNDPSNLVTSCDTCNFGKGARSLNCVPEPLQEKAAIIAEREAQLRGYHEVMEAARERRETDTWRVADIFVQQFSKDDSIRKDWFQSIRLFVEKLGVHDCLDSMESAVAKKSSSESTCFRYFCGICWRKIKEPAE